MTKEKTLTLTSPCGCGTCEDAAKAAMRYYNQAVQAGDCDIYRLRVAASIYTLALAEFKNNHVIENAGIDLAEHGPNYKPNNAMEAWAIATFASEGEDTGHALAEAIGKMISESDLGFAALTAIKGKYVAEEVKPH